WDCKGLHAGKRGPCGRFFARGVGLMIGLFSLNSPFFRCGRLLPSTSFHVVTRTAVRGVTDVEPVIHDYVEREGIAGIRGQRTIWPKKKGSLRSNAPLSRLCRTHRFGWS